MQTVTTDQTLSKNLVRAEQKTDKFCNIIEVGKSEYVYDAVIYTRRKNGEHQLVAPKHLVRVVIALNHDPIFAEHLGRKRTRDFVYTLLLARDETGRGKLRQGV